MISIVTFIIGVVVGVASARMITMPRWRRNEYGNTQFKAGSRMAWIAYQEGDPFPYRVSRFEILPGDQSYSPVRLNPDLFDNLERAKAWTELWVLKPNL